MIDWKYIFNISEQSNFRTPKIILADLRFLCQENHPIIDGQGIKEK